jgi:hypothetical protein
VTEFAGTPPSEREILWESRGTTQVKDVVLEKFLLRYNRKLEMPLVYLHTSGHGGNENRQVLLWFRVNGKAGAADWPELLKHVEAGYDIVTFDFRGLGETRMPFTAVSPDDPTLGKLEFDLAYSNPISGVLANYVYNSLLTGRAYFFQMIEDAEVARRFSGAKLHRNVTAVTAPDDGYTVAWAIAQILPDIKLLTMPNAKVVKWQELVEENQEVWPIQLLLPGGAYLH